MSEPNNEFAKRLAIVGIAAWFLMGFMLLLLAVVLEDTHRRAANICGFTGVGMWVVPLAVTGAILLARWLLEPLREAKKMTETPEQVSPARTEWIQEEKATTYQPGSWVN